jgi:lipid II:glycine glycyltransferase (peptidoglycan interpeptide bridge formation enzyme)
MIVTRKKSVVIADLYCAETPARIAADVARYNHWPTPCPGFRCPPFHTILIDLTQPEMDLLAQMGKGTRYEIRRAGNESLLAESVENVASALAEFCDFYDRAAVLKNLPPMDRNRLGAMAGSGRLALTRVRVQEEAPMAWHAYYADDRAAILLYSMSAHRHSSNASFQQLVGRANRYLHWQDILRFRQKGLAVMDLGGWYGGTEDTALLRINKFKEDLGGKVVEIYNSMAGITLKGKLAVWYILKKTKHAASPEEAR